MDPYMDPYWRLGGGLRTPTGKSFRFVRACARDSVNWAITPPGALLLLLRVSVLEFWFVGFGFVVFGFVFWIVGFWLLASAAAPSFCAGVVLFWLWVFVCCICLGFEFVVCWLCLDCCFGRLAFGLLACVCLAAGFVGL